MAEDFIKTSLKHYENCISLGWFCGTASAMSRLGLRSYSGPFDWYFSDYSGVLAQIENDFNDFMNKKNITISKDNSKTFEDIKYNFTYIHDVKQNFDDEYEMIKSKYAKRIKIFKDMSSLPTVFLRTVRNNEEIHFINKHWEYAEKLIKKYNSTNIIIYVLTSELDNITDNVESYRLSVPKYIGETYEMRHLFDTCQNLIIRCSNLIDYEKMKNNLQFDRKAYTPVVNRAYVFKCIEENTRGGVNAIIKSLHYDKVCGIYIWGAGKNGIPLAKYLRTHGVNVRGIIDNKLAGNSIEDFLVVSFDEIPNDSKIFISVSSKELNIEIEKQIVESRKEVFYRKYEDLNIET